MNDAELFDKQYHATEADRAASASIDHCQTCASLRFGKQADKRSLAEQLKRVHDVVLVWMESVK
jgi:hypothetical protein